MQITDAIMRQAEKGKVIGYQLKGGASTVAVSKALWKRQTTTMKTFT